MGLLNATVRDTLRPLPGAFSLRRSAVPGTDGPAPDDTPEPADNGALTIYRLQKDSGSTPPTASPGAYPADEAGRQASRPAGAAVITHDALLPDRKDSNGLETGKDRTLERQSDVSGTFASSVSADPVSPFTNMASAVAHGKPNAPPRMNESNRAFDSRKDRTLERQSDVSGTFASSVSADPVSPFTNVASAVAHGKPNAPPRMNESNRAFDSRYGSSKVWRQESRPDAPSGDLFPHSPAAPEPARTAPIIDGLMQAAEASRQRMAHAGPGRPRPTPDEPAAPRHGMDATPGISSDFPPEQAGNPEQRPASRGAPRPAEIASPPSPARQTETGARRSAAPRDTGAEGSGAPAARQTIIQQGPRLSIGRIEVVVLAPPVTPAPTTRPQSDGAAFLSKHYLRRL